VPLNFNEIAYFIIKKIIYLDVANEILFICSNSILRPGLSEEECDMEQNRIPRELRL
jgi:hypothetical protein